ncbi:MAG TPA: tetratricopeptide repeat protein [Longimicrobiales bacterium]
MYPRRIKGGRTAGVLGLLLTSLLGGALFPAAASGQRRPSNNMWTRSTALYLDRARKNPRPDEKRELLLQALEAVKEGIAKDPDNPQIWFLAGRTYVQLDSLAQADSAFTKAQELYPDYEKEIDVHRRNAWVARYNAGIGALQQQDIDGAIALLEKADLIYDKMPNARLQLGSLYAGKGEHERAVAAYRGALEILRGPAREGLEEKEAAQWRENEEIATFNLAQLLAQLGRDEEAAQAYRDFLAREPQNRAAKINLAIVLSRLGRSDEAAEIYTELMGQADVTANELFTIGLGLYNGEQFARAAEAFRKSLELNPHARDALYNLAQALYRQSTSLEEAREKASGDEERKAAADLQSVYDELRTVSEKLRTLDPRNRNVMLLLARAYRGLADVNADDAATSEAWRQKALDLLQAQEQLSFEVGDVRMAAEEGKVTISGSITNLKLEAGTPIRIRVIAVGKDGAEVGSQEVSVAAPAADAKERFEAVIEAGVEVAGWKYEVLE